MDKYCHGKKKGGGGGGSRAGNSHISYIHVILIGLPSMTWFIPTENPTRLAAPTPPMKFPADSNILLSLLASAIGETESLSPSMVRAALITVLVADVDTPREIIGKGIETQQLKVSDHSMRTWWKLIKVFS
jgi:hypothetical protein